MTYTAQYTDPEHESWKRSDRPESNPSPLRAPGNRFNVLLIEDGVAIDPWIDPVPLKDRLKTHLAAYRRAKVGGGFEAPVNGFTVIIDTSYHSLMYINGADARAKGNGSKTTKWKLADGTFQALTNSETKKMAESVSDWVNSCFEAEASVQPDIDKDVDPLTTEAEVETAYDVAFAAI